ncbi:MAG: polysaccharide deacetylase family protein, partial [Lachnoclostridium sp.]|nr:polysaccharide deacetylase family protein [Lachnoclostridium sp.]
MNIEWERKKLVLFTKVGVIILSCLALFISSFFYIPQTVDTLSRGISEKELPIYCVDQKEPKISLSFDAAWGNEDTRTILSILKKHDVKVTFFMTGGWVEKYPDDVKAIVQDGHDLGNHSENHKQMSQLSAQECEKELMSVHEKVKTLTGVEMELFRPPFGDYNDNLINLCKEIGYHV